MRLLPIIMILFAASLPAAELIPHPSYPLWDNTESVADYARKVNLSPTKTLDLGNGVKLELVLIPAGKFIMGTPEPIPVDEGAFTNKVITGQKLFTASMEVLVLVLIALLAQASRKKRRPQLSLALLVVLTLVSGAAVLSYMHWRESERLLGVARFDYAVAKARYDVASDPEKAAHAVTLTKPFYMGKYNVTQEQYQALIGTNPSIFKGKSNPVETVSWFDGQEFCKEVTERTKETFRLPTEPEWEYACRAGTNTTYYSGDKEADLARVAWFSANSKNTSHPVGQKEPNAFGLYDMHGNVSQWCDDEENSADSSERTERPLRGGSAYKDSAYCHSAFRRSLNSDHRRYDIGFRVVAPAFRPD